QPLFREFPGRLIDVGISEQHAVTMAGGLATQGVVPIVAIYSTFLQRAYDQVLHDVAVQDLSIVLALDRAGIVGDDGRTHQGLYDIAYLRPMPGMTLMAPRDERMLRHMLWTAYRHASARRGSIAVRFPRGAGFGARPDEHVDHGAQNLWRHHYGLDAEGIARAVRSRWPQLVRLRTAEGSAG